MKCGMYFKHDRGPKVDILSSAKPFLTRSDNLRDDKWFITHMQVTIVRTLVDNDILSISNITEISYEKNHIILRSDNNVVCSYYIDDNNVIIHCFNGQIYIYVEPYYSFKNDEIYDHPLKYISYGLSIYVRLNPDDRLRYVSYLSSDIDQKVTDFISKSIPIDIGDYLANKDHIYRIREFDDSDICMYDIMDVSKHIKMSIASVFTSDLVCYDCRSVFITKDHIYQTTDKIPKSEEFDESCQNKIPIYYDDINKLAEKISEMQNYIDQGLLSISIKDEITKFIFNLDIYKDFNFMYGIFIKTEDDIINIKSFYDIFTKLTMKCDSTED